MKKSVYGGLATIALLSACSTIDGLKEERVAEATVRLPTGVPIGTVQVLRQGDRLTLVAALTGFDPGTRGFHLHTVGKCTAPDFSSAGGHLNPSNRTHGSLSASGKHLGDLPNLEFGSNRSASAQIELPGNATDILTQMLDADGTAVVVHAQPDDYRTDPTGGAGSRVACGVFEAR